MSEVSLEESQTGPVTSKRTRATSSVLVLMLATAFFVPALGFPSEARMAPLLISSLVLALALLDVVVEVRRPARARSRDLATPSGTESTAVAGDADTPAGHRVTAMQPEDVDVGSRLLAWRQWTRGELGSRVPRAAPFLWVALFFGLYLVVGLYISFVLFSSALLVRKSGWSKWGSVLVSLGLAALFYGVFVFLLGFPSMGGALLG